MNHVVKASMRQLGDARILRYQFEIVAERSFPPQCLMHAAQIFKSLANIKFFVAILLFHSLLSNLFGFSRVDSVGEKHALRSNQIAFRLRALAVTTALPRCEIGRARKL